VSNLYLVKHGGPLANGKIDKSAKFLKTLINPKKTFLLFSSDKMASMSAMIINKTLKLEKEKVRRESLLKVKKNYYGSKDHQLMSFLFCFTADHYDDAEDIIVVSHEGLIRKTLNAFYDMYMPRESTFKTTIERGSVHFIDTINTGDNMKKIQKIFTLQ